MASAEYNSSAKGRHEMKNSKKWEVREKFRSGNQVLTKGAFIIQPNI